jgi:DNA-binding NarL/FixJ family response regulator
VLVAHEQGLFREALKVALEREPDLEVIAEAESAAAAVPAAEAAQPDIAILSAVVAAQECIRASCLMKERLPGCRTIVVADVEDQQLLTDGLGCGASGYLTKDASVADLVDAIRAVARGETLVPPVMLGPLLGQLLDRRRSHDEALWRIAELSPRERRVLNLLARGVRTKEIAAELVISPETARTHVQNILGKLSVHSRLEAAALVIEHGLHDRLAEPELAEQRWRG